MKLYGFFKNDQKMTKSFFEIFLHFLNPYPTKAGFLKVQTPLIDEAGFKKSNAYLTFLNYVSDGAGFFAPKIMNTFRKLFFKNPHNSLIFHFFLKYFYLFLKLRKF